MTLLPLCPGFDHSTEETMLGDVVINELDIPSIDRILGEGCKIQRDVSALSIDQRLGVLDSMGEMWERMVGSEEVDELADSLSRSTGYAREVIDLEVEFISEVLNGENIRRNLEASLPRGVATLEDFVEAGKGEYIRQVPAGPVFIVSSGNSIVPPLIPTVVSMVTGNLTLLKPSLANYEAIRRVASLVGNVDSPAARIMARSLVVSYFTHDSPSMDHLLTQGKLGVVNFWGGEPARAEVGSKLCLNPHHPVYFVNGPLTGVAIVDSASSNREVAEGLALNVVLYDQQLCSSPTTTIFLGKMGEARDFLDMFRESMNDLGGEMGMMIDDDPAFLLQSARRYLQFNGSLVRGSDAPENMWTATLDAGESKVRDAVNSYPTLNIHARKRFLEIVQVEDPTAVFDLIDGIAEHPAYVGIDKVQTVGLEVGEANRRMLLGGLAFNGVYRIVPIGDMFMRGAVEPYDGQGLANLFTYSLYMRDRPVELE